MGLISWVYLPGEVRKGRAMQVAHDADRRLLLGVIEKDRVLCGDGIHDTIVKRESRFRPRRGGAGLATFCRCRTAGVGGC